MSTRRLLFILCMGSLLSSCQPVPAPALTPAFDPITATISPPIIANTLAPAPTVAQTAALTLPPPTEAPQHLTFPKIDHRPRPVTIEDWKPWAGQTLKQPLTFDPSSENGWQMDYRTQNLSRLDLRSSLDDLLNAIFDDRTVWPASGRMPTGFDWQEIMELGKNPGLGIRKLHEQSITGKDVGIAIIDQPMLVTHEEYTGRLQLYEEIDIPPENPSEMHGPAVASLAVGKTIGVAPEADLYFIAAYNGTRDEKGIFTYDFTDYARAIRRILEINTQLPERRKIWVISISAGWGPGWQGYGDIISAVQAARDAGLLVVNNAPQDPFYVSWRDGLGRDPRSNPDDFNSYDRCWFAQLQAQQYPGKYGPTGKGMFLMDARTLASPLGDNAYWFSRRGGESWGPPYLAGLYALAAQVDPSITPERFWELAAKTGRTFEVSRDGKVYQLGPILDPAGLIQELQ